MGYLLDALRKFSSLILYLLQGQAQLLKHTHKGVSYSLFSLISNANQRKRIMTAFELLHKFGWFSLPNTHISDFLYLRGLYLSCPHTEIDRSSVESAREERLTQNAKGIIKGAAQPVEAQVCKS